MLTTTTTTTTTSMQRRNVMMYIRNMHGAEYRRYMCEIFPPLATYENNCCKKGKVPQKKKKEKQEKDSGTAHGLIVLVDDDTRSLGLFCTINIHPRRLRSLISVVHPNFSRRRLRLRHRCRRRRRHRTSRSRT